MEHSNDVGVTYFSRFELHNRTMKARLSRVSQLQYNVRQQSLYRSVKTGEGQTCVAYLRPDRQAARSHQHFALLSDNRKGMTRIRWKD
jgi:hypothetical protein